MCCHAYVLLVDGCCSEPNQQQYTECKMISESCQSERNGNIQPSLRTWKENFLSFFSRSFSSSSSSSSCHRLSSSLCHLPFFSENCVFPHLKLCHIGLTKLYCLFKARSGQRRCRHRQQLQSPPLWFLVIISVLRFISAFVCCVIALLHHSCMLVI